MKNYQLAFSLQYVIFAIRLMWLKISFRQNLQKIERKNFRKKVQKAQKMYQLVEVSFKSMKTLGLFFE